MKRKAKAVSVLLVISTMLVLFSGCSTYDNFKEAFIDKKTKTEDTIKIGVYEPLTGNDSEAGLAEVEGIELANRLYPEVLGKKIELVYADNKSDLDAAETAIVDLLKKNPLVVLGSYGNIYSLVANGYMEQVKVPGIAITNTNPLVTSNSPYYFRVCFVEAYQGEALARYANDELKQKTTAILIPEEEDQASVLANAYREKFEELTGNQDAIVAYETYKSGQNSFEKQLQTIQNKQATTVFITGKTGDITAIVNQAARMNLNLTFLGDSALDTKEFMNAANGYITGRVAFSDLYNTDETITATSQQFMDAYEREYGGKKDAEARTSAALGFDAYLLARQAIEKAGAGCTGEDVKAMLMETEGFPGASGEITLTETGDPMKPVVINTFENNEVVPICTISPFDEKQGQEESKNAKDTGQEENNGTEN